MNEFRADLHCHTNFSDGSCSPEELLTLAKEMGLGGLAITDHDTIASYATAIPYAESLDLPLLSGVEFSADYRGDPVHILGYAFTLKSEEILIFCEKHQIRRYDRNLKMLEKLDKLGISIDYEELEKAGGETPKRTIGRPHIAMILLERGIVSSIREAFIKYLGEGKKAFYPGEKVTVQETIDVIHQGGGKAVIAHPHLLNRNSTIRELLKMPFDGVEGYYAQMSKEREKRWVTLGKEKGWLITGGSDFHGDVKPSNPIGSSWVDKSTFDTLYDHFLSHSR